jgi:hypothetical protein
MLAIIRKDALADEKARLEQLLATMEKRVAAAFRTFIAETTSEAVVRHVVQLVSVGRINEALGVIDSQVASMAGSITSAFQDAATAETVALVQQVVGSVPVSISFDPTNPRAAALMRAERLEFIREFSDEQRAVVRDVIAAGLQSGEGPRQIATDFRAAIGLTQSQLDTVANYRRLLEQGSADALNRALRDRRFDGSVQRAADGGKPLSADQIDKMVERYRQRMLAYRAENFARSESGRALSLGRAEAMQQQIDAGIIRADQIDMIWRTIMDDRERLSHEKMNTQVQPWGGQFTSGDGFRLRWPHDALAPASETVQCRCSVIYRIGKR